MKRLLTALSVLLVLMFLAMPCFAQARYGLRTSVPRESEGIAVDDNGDTMDYAVWIYGISIMADEASSFMGVYDCDTLTELHATALTYLKDEIGEATQYDSKTVWFDNPKYFSDGVGIVIKTGVGWVHYGPEPTN